METLMASDDIVPLAWDSKHFGLLVGRLSGDLEAGELTETLARACVRVPAGILAHRPPAARFPADFGRIFRAAGRSKSDFLPRSDGRGFGTRARGCACPGVSENAPGTENARAGDRVGLGKPFSPRPSFSAGEVPVLVRNLDPAQHSAGDSRHGSCRLRFRRRGTRRHAYFFRVRNDRQYRADCRPAPVSWSAPGFRPDA